MVEELIFAIILVLVFLKISWITGLVCLTCAILYLKQKLSTTIQFHIVDDHNGMNESIILEARLNNTYNTLFMLDTGYAGPPVLSSSYLSIQDKCETGNVLYRYRSSLKLIKNGISEDKRNETINHLLKDGRCQAFTSGCTMRLVGIGSVVEQQADMLLCPMISFKNTFGWYVTSKESSKVDADVLVTNPLPSSVHILTCDYLMHASPTLIDMRNQILHLNMSTIYLSSIFHTFHIIPIKMVGGAFVISANVGGIQLELTVDTGAPGPVCLGKEASYRLKKCWKPEQDRKILQRGVNGEEICSDVFYSSFNIGSLNFEKVGVFANDTNVDGVDGYVGLGVLRAFDLLLLHTGIGFRKSGMLPKTSFKSASLGTCNLDPRPCFEK